ncbi:MAG: 3-hydroxyacyl-ACP dehydratase FabZ [Clostridia bacterium]|nr:3-hydroxyacyl-ACP dehydratase FabZ [Clostridia bacterium]
MSQVVFNKDQIKEIIPHREPILLVDDVLEINYGESIKTRLFVSPEFDFFRGHFPGAPVMPGVLTVEAMAQTSDILLLSFEKYKGKIPYFIGIDGVKFKKKIEPGDTIEIEAKINHEIHEKAIVVCDAVAYNHGEVAALGQVVLAMR